MKTYTIAEAAHICGVTEFTVRFWINEGYIHTENGKISDDELQTVLQNLQIY